MQPVPFALQLYSVCDHLNQDVGETLRRVKAVGFDRVELAGLAGLEPARFKDLMDAAGLSAVSSHVGLEAFRADYDGCVAAARLFGVEELAVPWLDPCDELSVWQARAREMAALGKRLREAGLRLSYHNHHHEFDVLDGQCIFDVIFDSTDPRHLAVQLDIGWATFAGADVYALLRKYSGRVASVHCKQFARAADGTPYVSELANGIIDWPPIVEAARAAGAAWFIAEQDESQGDSLASAAENAAFMKALRV